MKNMVKNYSEAEVKVREATSNDPWGPSSTLMSEISDMTYNIVALGEIMRMIWKRLNDHGKNWRHVYKSLVLLDYLIKNGNEKVAQQCKEHIVAIQTLKDFQFMDEQKDQGANVREKAKQLVNLLRDDDRLKEERAKAFRARERYAQSAMGIGSDNKMVFASGNPRVANKPNAGYADPYGGAAAAGADVNPDLEAVRPSDANEEDLQLKLAIMLSQQEHEEEEKRKRADDAKLQLALEQSKSEGQPNSGVTLPISLNPIINFKFLFLIKLVDIDPDPWTSSKPKSGADDFFSTNNDPWASLESKGSSNGHSVDPWTNGGGGAGANSTSSTNPWFASSNSAGAADPWTNGQATNKIDDFDMFSSDRVQPKSTVQSPPTVVDPFGDMFSNGNDMKKSTSTTSSTNPWDTATTTSTFPKSNSTAFDPFAAPIDNKPTTNGNGHLTPSTSSTAIRKTPESFLGENSSLVNLDNLIPARPKSTNPFGMGTSSNVPSGSNGFSSGMSSSGSMSQLNNPFGQPQVNKPMVPPMSTTAPLFPAFGSTQQQPVIMGGAPMYGHHQQPPFGGAPFSGIPPAANTTALFPSLMPLTSNPSPIPPQLASSANNPYAPATAPSNNTTNPFLMM